MDIFQLRKVVLSLSDGPGEPSGATRDPGGRSQRPPDCPDGMDGANVGVPARERG